MKRFALVSGRAALARSIGTPCFCYPTCQLQRDAEPKANGISHAPLIFADSVRIVVCTALQLYRCACTDGPQRPNYHYVWRFAVLSCAHAACDARSGGHGVPPCQSIACRFGSVCVCVLHMVHNFAPQGRNLRICGPCHGINNIFFRDDTRLQRLLCNISTTFNN